MAKLCPLMSELRWAYPLLSTISLLSFFGYFPDDTSYSSLAPACKPTCVNPIVSVFLHPFPILISLKIFLSPPLCFQPPPKSKDTTVPLSEGTAHKLRPSLSTLRYTFCPSILPSVLPSLLHSFITCNFCHPAYIVALSHPPWITTLHVCNLLNSQELI